MISVCFQGKLFTITVIQVYAPTTNAKTDEAEWLYEDLQDVLRLTPTKDELLTIGAWNAEEGNKEIPGVTGKFGLGVQNEARQKANRVLSREHTGHSKHPFPTTQETILHTDIRKIINTEIRWIIFSAGKDGEALYRQKNKTGS